MNNSTKDKINLLIFLAGIGAVIFGYIFLLSVSQIGYSVKQYCQLAKAKYPGDCVQALSSHLDDQTNDFASRNMAIWALGQLDDEQALETLNKYYTGYGGEHCPRDQMLCQLELERAIGYLKGNPNITPFFWRFGL